MPDCQGVSRLTSLRHSSVRIPISGGGNGGGVDSVDRGGWDCDAGRLDPTEGDSHSLICRVRRLRNDEVVVGISIVRIFVWCEYA